MPRREIQVSIERSDRLEDFGKALKAKRKAKHLSQHELGHNVGEGVESIYHQPNRAGLPQSELVVSKRCDADRWLPAR